MTHAKMSAAAEWRAHFMLPIAAALGYATSVIHIYGLGSYIQPISDAFGWSRTQVTAGLTIATLGQTLFCVPFGLLVDRYGPRRFGIFGALTISAAFALLGTANGEISNWYLLWALIALAAMPVQATVWTSAVASRFDASRGLALAVALCGASVATAVFPIIGVWLIDRYGWQSAIPLHAGFWLLLTFPFLLLFFRGAKDQKISKDESLAQAAPVLEGSTLREGVRSTVYHRLLLASLLFTFTIIALVVHFVPILTDGGANPMKAAGIASLIGIFSIVGRLGTGLLLDKVAGSVVGGAVFFLPALASLLLLLCGDTLAGQMAAATLIGLTLGAEIDVIVYLTTRHFGLKHFGALYGGLLAALSIGTATGPLGAAAIYDQTGNYALFLWAAIGFMIVSSIALFTLPRPAWNAAHDTP